MWRVRFILFVLNIIIDGAESIANGHKACEGPFPYIAAIWRREQWMCGGTIIDEKHVLTAAHCIGIMKETDCSVTVGAVNVRSPSILRFMVRHFHPHPEYTRRTNIENAGIRMVINDIAIIELLEKFNWSPQVQPAVLRRQPSIPNCGCFIAGWGTMDDNVKSAVEELRWAEVFIMSTLACRQLNVAGRNELCAFNPITLASGTSGDSGGPFTCGGELAGVVTVSKRNPPAPTVFLRLYPYLSFIEGVLNYSLPRAAPTQNVFEFLNREGLLCT